MMACFGARIAADAQERNHRFLEEALELVQACGATQSEAHQLVDYVYGRPIGEKAQEVGGVMVTLAALCLAQDLNMHAAGETELARIWTKVEAIRAKQAAKPKHSPLPQSAPVSEGGKGEGVAWSVTGATVRTLAAELIRAAESMGEENDELTLTVKRPGTVAGDDGVLNQRHILAVSLADYPEEGVYPVDPEDPTGGRVDAGPQPSAKALTEEEREAIRKIRDALVAARRMGVARVVLPQVDEAIAAARALLADHSRDVTKLAAEQPADDTHEASLNDIREWVIEHRPAMTLRREPVDRYMHVLSLLDTAIATGAAKGA